MASVTLNVAPTISSGTATVYAQANWPYGTSISGAPVGSSVTSGSVGTDGKVTFSGLSDATLYVAYQASPDRYVRFRTPTAVVPTSSERVVAASGDTTGAADTVAIQAALNAGGYVQGVPGGTYYIAKGSGQAVALAIGAVAGTTLDMTGCTVNLVASQNCPMIASLGHAQLLNGGSWVAAVDARVIGGVWSRGANAGTGNSMHNIIIGGTNPEVRGVHCKSTAGKYAVLVQNATDFIVKDVYLDSVFSDGVHIQGPAVRGAVENIRGTTGDDLFAITPCDWTAYTWGNEGDVTDIKVDGLFPKNGGSRACNILGGTTGASNLTILNTKRVRIRNVTGNVTGTQPAIIVGDDTSQANTSNGQLDDIEIDGVSVAFSTTTQSLVSIAGSTNSLTIPKLTLRNLVVNQDAVSVVSNNSKVTTLSVDGVKCTTATAPLTRGIVSNADGNAWPAIARLFLARVDATYTGTRGSGLLRSITSGHTLTEVFLTDVYVNNPAWGLGDFITSTTFRLSNVHMANNGGIFNSRSGSAIVIAGWSGCSADTNSSTAVGAGSVQSLAVAFPFNIGDAALAKNNGDKCTTRSLNGAVAAVQEVEYFAAGTHWYDRRGNASTA